MGFSNNRVHKRLNEIRGHVVWSRGQTCERSSTLIIDGAVSLLHDNLNGLSTLPDARCPGYKCRRPCQ